MFNKYECGIIFNELKRAFIRRQYDRVEEKTQNFGNNKKFLIKVFRKTTQTHSKVWLEIKLKTLI